HIVKKKRTQRVITAPVPPDSWIHTDEYAIYTRLPAWGYRHKTVCHGRGEYARDEDRDGFLAAHVNTIEGFCVVLRPGPQQHHRRLVLSAFILVAPALRALEEQAEIQSVLLPVGAELARNR